MQISKKNRSTNKSFNGKAFWQPIKKILSDSNLKVKKWKSISKSYTKTIMGHPEFVINGYGKAHMIELNHFLIQTIRIPTTEKPLLRKIIQVALNIGQYNGTKKSSDQCLKYVTIYDYVPKKYCKIKLTDILSNSNIKKLDKYLSKFK
jgi:hypothetical protein